MIRTAFDTSRGDIRVLKPYEKSLHGRCERHACGANSACLEGGATGPTTGRLPRSGAWFRSMATAWQTSVRILPHEDEARHLLLLSGDKRLSTRLCVALLQRNRLGRKPCGLSPALHGRLEARV